MQRRIRAGHGGAGVEAERDQGKVLARVGIVALQRRVDGEACGAEQIAAGGEVVAKAVCYGQSGAGGGDGEAGRHGFMEGHVVDRDVGGHVLDGDDEGKLIPGGNVIDGVVEGLAGKAGAADNATELAGEGTEAERAAGAGEGAVDAGRVEGGGLQRQDGGGRHRMAPFWRVRGSIG